MKKKFESDTWSNPPACSRSSETPETDGMASMRRATSEWVDLCGKLERERDEYRKLADDALATLREIKTKYGLGDRHVTREKNREIEKLRSALQKIVACGLNCKDSLDEAEQMERIAKEALSSENDGGMAQELAAQKHEPTTDLNG